MSLVPELAPEPTPVELPDVTPLPLVLEPEVVSDAPELLEPIEPDAPEVLFWSALSAGGRSLGPTMLPVAGVPVAGVSLGTALPAPVLIGDCDAPEAPDAP